MTKSIDEIKGDLNTFKKLMDCVQFAVDTVNDEQARTQRLKEIEAQAEKAANALHSLAELHTAKQLEIDEDLTARKNAASDTLKRYEQDIERRKEFLAEELLRLSQSKEKAQEAVAQKHEVISALDSEIASRNDKIKELEIIAASLREKVRSIASNI